MSPDEAAPITFYAVDAPGVSGFVTFDDATFTGVAEDRISNAEITALSLTVLGFSFALGDVTTTADTFLDTTGIPTIVVNGVGSLASNGSETIAFFPDGFGGSPVDGDASLALDTDGTFTFGGADWEAFIDVRWSVEPPSGVPGPATALLRGIGEREGDGPVVRHGRFTRSVRAEPVRGSARISDPDLDPGLSARSAVPAALPGHVQTERRSTTIELSPAVILHDELLAKPDPVPIEPRRRRSRPP